MVKRLSPVLLGLCLPLLFVGVASAEKAPFGLKFFEISANEAPLPGQAPDAFGRELGPPDVQAGSHPYSLTTTFVLDGPEVQGEDFNVPRGRGVKDVRVQLPPGFVGNPNATAKCSYYDFTVDKASACPTESEVGVETTVLGEPNTTQYATDTWYRGAVYNVESPGGVAAEFGYYAAGVAPILIEASVRTGSDYGITVNVHNIPQVEQVWASTVTIWGVPGDNHETGCGTVSNDTGLGEPGEGLWLHEQYIEECAGPLSTSSLAKPLLTNPTSCGASREASISVDDWEEPGNFATEPGTHAGEKVYTETAKLPALTGCEKLDFSPTLGVTPDGSAGSTPTGLNVHVHVPQESTTNPEGLAEADVKDTTVLLPPGVQISPSASDGLQGCSNAQIGFEGYEELDGSGRQTPIFKPKVYNPETGKEEATLCPDASKIANARIATPLLEHELTGAVYLAAPQNFVGLPENPFSSLIAMYFVAEEPEHGVLVKVPGRVSLNEATGQITTTFENTPELPYSDLQLEFFGTSRAPLATPAYCGTYDTEASFAPWSGEPAAHPPASFQITSGPNGSPCSNPLPFSPTLDSGTTNINAGSYSELDTTLSRQDGEQSISSVQLHYPTGVSGLLSGVKLCGEQQANEGTCGPESLIGESIVSVGLGNDPYTVRGGKVYITGPYRGAPFGLSIVNPAKAGPYVLQEGRPVVVRAKIEVDPHTAALTVTTDPPGTPHAIPTMIEGIPLQIKHVNVLVNRPDFTFNPTNCNPQTITSTIDSAEGASAPASIPFQVTNCGDLKFAPKFSVSTSGKTSRADGESLAVKLSYPNGPGYSNIAKVKVELPKGLPSRLSTLQKACTAAQFNANPAGCPAASLVGYAKAVTPLIPVPLEGPAYFVSNGAEAFPNLVVVLQGYGVTIDLVGDTFISKSGVTSSTFKSVPDAPVGSFELTLPEGPYSALTTDGNPCTNKNLTMPTEFVAQDGTTIDQSTKIAVTGCPKSKAAKRHHKARRRHGRGKAARGGKRTGRAGR